jgi:polysaccharide deacetylase family protein (PEP-CTERM system associated)
MKNVISVDLEQWFHRFSLRGYIKDVDIHLMDLNHVVKATEKILAIFRKYNKVTTFFVLGEVASSMPYIVKRIGEEGHEVAFHGYSHRGLSELGLEGFRQEVEKGVSLLEHITKQKVLGFRAPNFSLNNRTAWALRVLEKHGFKYDSSIFPAITPRFAPYTGLYRLYFPSYLDLTQEGLSRKLVEFPLLSRRFLFLRIPAAGGFYLRLFGCKFILESIRRLNKEGYPAMCYVHPWEVYGFPRISLPVHKRFVAYYKVPLAENFERLVRKVDVAPAIELLETLGL